MNGHTAAELDVLVVGAGFSGLHFLYKLRRQKRGSRFVILCVVQFQEDGTER
jgi:cation diffusion facilitator CzcD-associated flavoprotein CzcO